MTKAKGLPRGKARERRQLDEREAAIAMLLIIVSVGETMSANDAEKALGVVRGLPLFAGQSMADLIATIKRVQAIGCEIGLSRLLDISAKSLSASVRESLYRYVNDRVPGTRAEAADRRFQE